MSNSSTNPPTPTDDNMPPVADESLTTMASYPRRRKKSTAIKHVITAVMVHLAVFGGVYMLLFHNKNNATAQISPTTPSTSVNTAETPLTTLSEAELSNDELVTQNTDDSVVVGNTEGDTPPQTPVNTNTTQPTPANPSQAKVAPNGARPQPPQREPIVPNNQRVPPNHSQAMPTQAPIHTAPTPPSEQGSSDPSINSRTSDGRALIAAINDADKENDALRETLDKARQLNDAKIEQSRNRPHLTQGQGHVEQSAPPSALTADDIPMNEQ